MISLRSIRTFPHLVRYLEDELGWPLEGYGIEDLTFDYEPDELGLKPEDTAKIKSIRQEEGDMPIRTAKRRGILNENRGQLQIDRTPIDQWDRTFLKTQFLAVINQNGHIWLERDEAIRNFARWLGFRRTGHLIQETALSLINGLLRDRSIEKDGQDWIRRV